MEALKRFIEVICTLLGIGSALSFFLAVLAGVTDDDSTVFFMILMIICFILYVVIYEIATACGVPIYK